MTSNKSLKLLLQYESDSESSSSSSSSSSEDDNGNQSKNFRNYREKNESSESDNDSDCETVLSTVDTESVCSESGEIVKRKKKSTTNLDSYPEEDLPPVENLQISVPSEHCQEIGKIRHSIEEMNVTVVQSYRNQAALNIDSVLFLDCGRRVLGKIYDVFGQVQQPQYVVRFNSREELQAANLTDGMSVYAAPKLPFSIYVFMKDVLANRGSDASWIDDREPPADCVEFSDDEQENQFRKERVKKRSRSSK